MTKVRFHPFIAAGLAVVLLVSTPSIAFAVESQYAFASVTIEGQMVISAGRAGGLTGGKAAVSGNAPNLD